MLKRLFIAVFVIGLVVGLSGTANCDVNKGTAIPYTPSVGDPGHAAATLPAGPERPTFKKPITDRHPAGNIQIPALKQSYFCDVQDYTSGTPYWWWTIPDAYGDDLFNMRFTSDANYDCTLMVAHLLMAAEPQVGAPTVRVYLWDDDGFGFPGNKLDSVDVLNPGDGLQGQAGVAYWVNADFTTSPGATNNGGPWVFSDGQQYHIGFTQLDQGSSVIAILSDHADGPYVGDERSSEYYNGAWGTMLGDWGDDVGFFVWAERCCSEIPYSDCFTVSYYQNSITNYYRIPQPLYGDSEFATRFDVTGPETLVSVNVGLYDPEDGSFGDNDVYVTVYDDDGGLPGAQVAQVTMPAGTYPAFPTLATATMPAGVVLYNDFHIGISTNGVQGVSWENLLASANAVGDLRTSVYADTTNFDGTGLFGWANSVAVGYSDRQLVLEADVCLDEYADCSWNSCIGDALANVWRLPDTYGDYIQAQKFTGVGKECRVQNVDLLLYWHPAYYTYDFYTYSSDVKVWADAGGYPGAELASITVNPEDYGIAHATSTTATSAWLYVDFTPLNVLVTGSYWVGIQSNAPDATTGIMTVSDNATGPCAFGYVEGWGDWGYMTDDWSSLDGKTNVAMILESQHCCIPYSERTCLTPFDWSTFQGDQARDGASFVEMSDSWCDLTMNWKFEHPTNGVAFTGPVVYGDKVICSFTTEYRVFQIDGTPLYSYVPSLSFAAGDIRCAPTVTTIAGYPDPVFFAAGGSNGEVSMVNLNTGLPVWTRAVGTVGPTGMYGAVRWGVFTVLNMGGADYVFWGTDNGRVVGVDALTGMSMIPGYPVNLSQSTWVSGSTDGTNLYYATNATAVEGDVYSIDAATGAINWSLSSTGGLQGADLFVAAGGTYGGDESFTGGVSYDAQRDYVYVNSRVSLGNYPADGVFYRINASNGSLPGPATLANRCYYATPVIDANRVYVASLTRWSPPPAGGNVYAVNKGTGLIDWAVQGYPGQLWPYFYCSGVLSCEPNGVADQLFVFGYHGYMSCLDAETGDQLWRRRMMNVAGDGTTQRGFAGALQVDGAGDSHLLFADSWGNLYDLKKQADRPRLEFQTYQPAVPVEFGSAPSLIVTIPNVFANTGCTDLNVTSVAYDLDSYDVDVPTFTATNVDDQAFERAAKIADSFTEDLALAKYIRASKTDAGELDAMTVRGGSNERTVDHTAAGLPGFINGIMHPAVGDVIAPGDTLDLVMDVVQAAILRGPQSFYLQLGTDDPDFFLNDPTLLPQMFITIVGGCLIDTTTLDFGVGAANFQLVSNTGRLATGDWGDGASGANGFYIGGQGKQYYQGSYVWAVSTDRIATNTQAWSGGGEAQSFISMQPDPNWCDNDCKPFLDAGVTLGYSSADGLTYTPITGNMVCKSFLDSVQNFDVGGTWDWEDWGAPFTNDSTMGLFAVSKTVGAVDPPAEVASLANLSLELLEITERNGRDVPNWFMGEFWDCDLSNDHVAIDRSISTTWVYNDGNPTFVWGQIKVPFGCGEEPIINTFETWGNSTTGHGFWDWYQYWDTCYAMLSSPPGAYYFVPDGDEEAHMTFAGHDFTPNETYKIGIAHFALFNLTDASVSDEFADMSRLVNKWAGYGRGDVNNDGAINLADIIYLAGTVNGGPGAIPFQHLSDVNADGTIDGLDVDYLVDYYFNCGPCPVGDFAF